MKSLHQGDDTVRGSLRNWSCDCSACSNCVIRMSGDKIMSCKAFNKLQGFVNWRFIIPRMIEWECTSALVPEILSDRFEHSAFNSLTALGRYALMRALESRSGDGSPDFALELMLRMNCWKIFLTGGGMGVTRLILSMSLPKCRDVDSAKGHAINNYNKVKVGRASGGLECDKLFEEDEKMRRQMGYGLININIIDRATRMYPYLQPCVT